MSTNATFTLISGGVGQEAHTQTGLTFEGTGITEVRWPALGLEERVPTSQWDTYVDTLQSDPNVSGHVVVAKDVQIED